MGSANYTFQPWKILVPMPWFLRFTIGSIIAVTIGLLYMYFFQYMHGGFWGDPAASIGTLVLLPIMVFNWMYWWTLSMDNWPFSLWLPQPFQGLAVGFCALVLGYFTFYLFHNVLKWDAQIFPFGVWWLFFVFAIPAWMGDLLTSAYERRQPITGISIQITSIGLGIIGWWFSLGVTTDTVLTGIGIKGVPIGMPFVWFCAAVTFAFGMGMWPFNVKQPAQFVLQVGYMAFYSLIYLGLMHALDMDFFVGPPLHGPVYSILWILLPLYWIGLGGAWPFGETVPWKRGLIVIGGSMILVYFSFKLFVLPAAASSPNAALFMTSALNWGLGLFVGWAITWANMGWLYLPPPPLKTKEAAIAVATG